MKAKLLNMTCIVLISLIVGTALSFTTVSAQVDLEDTHAVIQINERTQDGNQIADPIEGPGKGQKEIGQPGFPETNEIKAGATSFIGALVVLSCYLIYWHRKHGGEKNEK